MNLILITRDGRRLCKDRMFRDFAHFGTPSWCVKEYRSLLCAHKRANKIGGDVVVIPENMSVDASGLVIETKNCLDKLDKVGYITYHHHKIEEFIHGTYPYDINLLKN